MKNKHWYYEKIIKEENLKDKWLNKIPVTQQEIAEMIYIEKHIARLNIYER